MTREEKIQFLMNAEVEILNEDMMFTETTEINHEIAEAIVDEDIQGYWFNCCNELSFYFEETGETAYFKNEEELNILLELFGDKAIAA